MRYNNLYYQMKMLNTCIIMDYPYGILSKQDAQVIWRLMKIPSVMTGFCSLHAG